MEPVAFMNELWLAHHCPPHKGTIMNRLYPGSDLLVTKWHWNLELQHDLLLCKLFVSFNFKELLNLVVTKFSVLKIARLKCSQL